AAGRFSFADGAPANSIAAWTGAGWVPLGDGVDDVVRSLLVQNGELLAGGFFTVAGGQPVRGIARWNGTQWAAVGDPAGLLSGHVHALAVHDDQLIAAGRFSAPLAMPWHVARLDGTQWVSLGNGPNDWVYALGVHGNSLFAGGSFTTASGASARGIARWDGTNWTALGEGVGGSAPLVKSLIADGGHVAAGGDFT